MILCPLFLLGADGNVLNYVRCLSLEAGRGYYILLVWYEAVQKALGAVIAREQAAAGVVLVYL